MQREEAIRKTPGAFVHRRLHSFLGIWLVLFLIEHLLTNSEAALFFGADGEGFINMVNFIHSLPYLPLIEVALLLIPFSFHIVLGIKYLHTMRQNAYGNDPSKPLLKENRRNHAYTWQRITSWLLVLLIILHVGQMRFLKYPESVRLGSEEYFLVKAKEDPGLPTLSARLGVVAYPLSAIAIERRNFEIEKKARETATQAKEAIVSLFTGQETEERASLLRQELQQKEQFVEALESFSINHEEVVLSAKSMGTAILMNVRETFKSPLMLILYSFFVLAAVFHASNGVFTFAVTWGICLSERGQRIFEKVSFALMALLGFLGLIAIWGTYLINLKY